MIQPIDEKQAEKEFQNLEHANRELLYLLFRTHKGEVNVENAFLLAHRYHNTALIAGRKVEYSVDTHATKLLKTLTVAALDTAGEYILKFGRLYRRFLAKMESKSGVKSKY